MSNEIERSVRKALTSLYKQDAALLRNDVNERAITHKIAEYLELEFPSLDVDCEYNRNHDEPKRLMLLGKKRVRIDNIDGVSVFPDIIVHKRTTNNENLLVIEVKKSTSRRPSNFDKEKLFAFDLTPFFGPLLS